MSELKRRDAGLWYDPADPEIDAIHQISRRRCHQFNTVNTWQTLWWLADVLSTLPGVNCGNRQSMIARLEGQIRRFVSASDKKKRNAILRKLIGDGLGKDPDIKEPFLIDFGNQLTLGDRVFINHGCTILACGKIYIGDEVRFGPNVTILGVKHPLSAAERGYEPGKRANQGLPINIGRRAWIGSDVVICGGATIGEDAFVHANSVVTRDVPAGAIVGGIPATFMSWTPGYERDVPAAESTVRQRRSIGEKR